MALSIASLAREQTLFIKTQLDQIEHALHPSVTEDEELVRRALFAVRNKSVIFDRYIPSTTNLYAAVQDVRPTQVLINFRDEIVHCDCPHGEWCRHKVSVILSLYQYIDSVQDWTAKWRSKKSVNLHLLATERTPESWLAMVDEVMSHLLPEGRPIEKFQISTVAENADSKLKRHLPFEREWQPLYELFMQISILNKIWQHLNLFGNTIHSDYFEYFFNRRFEKIQNTIHELSVKSRLFATDPFFDALQVLVRELLLERKAHIGRRLNVYLLFWDNVFIEKSRAEEELEILQNYLMQEENPLSSEVLLPTILNIFHILLKNYEALKLNVASITPEQMNIYFGLAKFSHSRHDDEASEYMLKAMLPLLNDYIQHHLTPSQRQMYVRRIHALYENVSLTEPEELLLYSAFGVYGVAPFSGYLLKQKRYEEWVALHQLYPSSISYLDSCGLKVVLEEAPSLTLPLYHYYALEEVNQKSRMNYKQAVRIWKMMKSAAKKSGKTNFWEDYIHTVREQFKRLRALQEELEKGNLLV
ncbi:hypothetical protein D1B33_03805 [Lysinibacillus yapensis]|uniref:SWIM-type domain-containing protein n=1 Tax=Ureibacillus yapensis TaxID=2304605 RepID=A0A396SU13_9BACL|nr:hypothetical protein [Lysinibacillus yapensis]RHW39981.1 hypothetical protein D1B33_03805 [Lysinibacillus yapensis]